MLPYISRQQAQLPLIHRVQQPRGKKALNLAGDALSHRKLRPDRHSRMARARIRIDNKSGHRTVVIQIRLRQHASWLRLANRRPKGLLSTEDAHLKADDRSSSNSSFLDHHLAKLFRQDVRMTIVIVRDHRSEERRVGKGSRSRRLWSQ